MPCLAAYGPDTLGSSQLVGAAKFHSFMSIIVTLCNRVRAQLRMKGECCEGSETGLMIYSKNSIN
jgi:hypothetical protein